MNNNTSFSLSLQKKLSERNLGLDSEVNKAFNEFKIKSMLHRCNMLKQKGYATATLLYLLILLPFLKKFVSCFWDTPFFTNQLDAKKDTYYRFLNYERFNWRKLVYLLALRVIAATDGVAFAQKVLIFDNIIAKKIGKDIELVSYHFDHKSQRSVLGYQCL